ncbi:nucleotidyltransferase family protein [Aquimarina sp. AU58]|uniref:nucleotidyltransferase family protein n=1 Tax=Aquimarina sp. AU58 TaxID=1874112 RepID=UPI00190E8698|nr:nucleotidyltransferase family protein [Aquimarina sp. AU58]
MIEILENIKGLNLNDCWVGAGFIRNKIWDYKHGFDRTELNDIDVIYFNDKNPSKKKDLLIEKQLSEINSDINWSVKNQARMNLRNGHAPYEDCFQAISYWPETATAIAVRLNTNDEIEFIAPYGLVDLFNLIVIPTPGFDLKVYNDRIASKSWIAKWCNLNIKTGYNTI